MLPLGGFVLLACLSLGGGTRPGFLADAILQALALPLLLAAIWMWPSQAPKAAAGSIRIAMGFCFALVALHLVQLVPLPPSIWTRLPDRDVLIESFKVLGREASWHPISVSPRSTWLSLLALMPTIAVFLGVLLIGYRGRRALSLLVVGFAAVTALLGLLQLAQGPGSVLRPFDFTNREDAVGLFANRNHFAALLYTSMLLLSAWAATTTLDVISADKKRITTLAIVGAVTCFVVLLALVSAQSMTRSRAGVAFTMLAMLGGLFIPVSRHWAGAIKAGRMSLIGMMVAVVFASQYALYRIVERMSLDPLADARLPYARNTLEAAKANFPFGSGIGTFVPVYAPRERVTEVAEVFANRAHNDFLEAFLETGAAGIVLLLVLLFWLAERSVRIWRHGLPGGEPIDNLLARAATLVVALLLVHSFLDYPLRTGAMAAVLAMACALMLPPPLDAGVTTSRAKRASHEAARSRSGQAKSTKVAPGPTPAAALPRMETLPPLPRLDGTARPPKLDVELALPKLDTPFQQSPQPSAPTQQSSTPPPLPIEWPATPARPANRNKPEDGGIEGFDWPESWRKKPPEQK